MASRVLGMGCGPNSSDIIELGASYAACLAATRSVTDSQNNNRACPNFLKPVGPRRNGRTCLRVEMDGLTVGWAWWDDDDMAADCEYVPVDMTEEKSFGGGDGSTPLSAASGGGMLS